MGVGRQCPPQAAGTKCFAAVAGLVFHDLPELSLLSPAVSTAAGRFDPRHRLYEGSDQGGDGVFTRDIPRSKILGTGSLSLGDQLDDHDQDEEDKGPLDPDVSQFD